MEYQQDTLWMGAEVSMVWKPTNHGLLPCSPRNPKNLQQNKCGLHREIEVKILPSTIYPPLHPVGKTAVENLVSCGRTAKTPMDLKPTRHDDLRCPIVNQSSPSYLAPNTLPTSKSADPTSNTIALLPNFSLPSPHPRGLVSQQCLN